MTAILAIDAAWTARQPSGVALVCDAGDTWHCVGLVPSYIQFEHLAAGDPGDSGSKLRGWVNYFRVGRSSRCLGYVKDWVEKKIRRHLMRARQRQGFGWKRWSRQWLYGQLGLFSDYWVAPRPPKVLPAQ